MSDLAAERRTQFKNRVTAHSVLFRHRHEYPFAPFHLDLIADFWSDDWAVVDLAFREAGKTTVAEEGLVIAACDEVFRNGLIIGAKEALAAELLASVKSELENNDEVISTWGDMRGETWTQTKLVFRDGRCLQAVGRDQTLRGTKHGNWRPDFVVINDFEDDDEILTPEGRRRTLRWVLKVLLPACDRRRRKIRIYDTLRDPDSVPMRLIKSQNWPHRLIPVSYLDEKGEEKSSWPGHPTLTPEWIAHERQVYAGLGELDIWEREYMMLAQSHADRAFTPEMIKVEPVPRAWQAVYAMIDPARTRTRTSATTGWAAWSWVNHRLIVWEAGAARLLPDEIIDLAFRLVRDYSPVQLGIEKQGLDQWLSQPIRQRMIRDGVVIPYEPVAAIEQGSLINALQTFYAQGEVTHAREFPELRDQLLSFPTGVRDALNALGYATTMRPGRLIYENWNPNANIAVVEPSWGRPLYLAANADGASVYAALVQLLDDRVVVLADWVAEGDAGISLERVVRDASMVAQGQALILVAAPQHWQDYHNVGLIQAARAIGLECRQGGGQDRGRALIRREIGRQGAGGWCFQVTPQARWTLNALAGGYSLPLRDGLPAGAASDNRYKLLMEAIETLAGLFAFGLRDEDDDFTGNFAYDSAGRRYRSALPQRMREHLARH